MGCTSKEVLKTRDGQELTYKYFEGGWSGVILIHQLGGQKEDWEPLEKSLEREGISYLAIDLRGHGDSSDDWMSFKDEDFADMIYDVEAAEKFMRQQGVNVHTIIGASVGANVVYKYALWKDVESIILLSPGFVYKGIDISHDAGNYTGNNHIIVGTADTYSKTTADVFVRDEEATLVTIPGLRHGVELLPAANTKIIEFLTT